MDTRIFLVALALAGCVPHPGAAPGGSSSSLGEQGKQSTKDELVTSYAVLVGRENFIFPTALDDYAIDSAMRLGRGPGTNEPEGITSDPLMLEAWLGQLASLLGKERGEAYRDEVLLHCETKYGLTWWLVGYSRTADRALRDAIQQELTSSPNRCTTYCRLALIKEKRVQQGNWHP